MKKQINTNGYQNFINNLFEKDTFNRYEEFLTDETKFDSSCLKNFKKLPKCVGKQHPSTTMAGGGNLTSRF